MFFNEKIDWCIDRHRQTNHFYDQYLPYEFHLRMVYQVFKDYEHLLDNNIHYFGEGALSEFRGSKKRVTLRYACELAVWGHDLIEDARASYNDVCDKLGEAPANIIFAVTNMRGKTRAERANAEYYRGIRETPGAVFVKLCDRIANVQYSKLTKSRMFEMYHSENLHFIKELGWSETEHHPYTLMFTYLISLFNY